MDFADQIVITEVWIVLILLLWEVWRLKKEIKRVLNIVNINQATNEYRLINLHKKFDGHIVASFKGTATTTKKPKKKGGK